MKRRIHEALLSIAGLTGVAFLAISGMSCESPQMQCAVGHGPFTVVYEYVSGDQDCYEKANRTYAGACFGQYGLHDDLADCAGLSRVEHVGFSTFLGVKGRKETEVKYTVPAADPSMPPVEKTYTAVSAEGADYNTRNIAVQSSVMGTLGGDDATDKAYAFGKYTSFPDANDICYAGGGEAGPLAAAESTIGDAAMPSDSLKQEWSDIRFYVTAGVPGTQTVGTMRFQNNTPGATCSAEYKFTGLYPAVFCGDAVMGDYDDDKDPMTSPDNDTDDDGDPMTPVTNDKDDDGDPMTPVDDDDGMPGPDVDVDEQVPIDFTPNDVTCDPKADPANGRVFGSGINPDFKTYCHPELLHCVLQDGTGLIK